jgi:hypothetical protein
MNHDGESVDRQSDSAQSENSGKTMPTRGDEHHDESVGRYQSVQAREKK